MKPIVEAFVQQTAFHDFAHTGRRRGEPQPPIAWDAQPGQVRIACIPPAQLPLCSVDVRTAIQMRKSVRSYGHKPLSFAQLCLLLWCTQGVKERCTFNGAATKRNVPSAGAKHALEVFFYARRVETLAPGWYRYLAMTHEIVCEKPDTDGAAGQALTSALCTNTFEAQGAVTFVYAAVPERMVWHPGQRGYRSLYLDAGHVGQNLSLAAEGLGLGACTLCVFDDQALQAQLALAARGAFPIYAAVVGTKAPV